MLVNWLLDCDTLAVKGNIKRCGSAGALTLRSDVRKEGMLFGGLTLVICRLNKHRFRKIQVFITRWANHLWVLILIAFCYLFLYLDFTTTLWCNLWYLQIRNQGGTGSANGQNQIMVINKVRHQIEVFKHQIRYFFHQVRVSHLNSTSTFVKPSLCFNINLFARRKGWKPTYLVAYLFKHISFFIQLHF